MSTAFPARKKGSHFLCFLILPLVLFTGCESRIAHRDSKGKNIICFGDSITRGAGSTEGNDYPFLLSKKLNLEVLNAGANGNTTEDALSRMQSDVLDRDPRLVIIEFSGNDFLQGLPLERTLRNIDRMVVMAQARHAMVVLVEVAAGYFGDQYLAGFKEIAEKRQALLIPNIMEGIMADPSLKSDEIHPNDKGYRLIAERIYEKIKPLL